MHRSNAMNEATDTQKQISEEIDKFLLDVLKNGQVAVDEEGKAVRVTPAAAYIRAAMDRLKMVGNVTPAAGTNSNIEQLRQHLAENGKLARGIIGRVGTQMPPLSEDEDAASA